MTYKLPLEHKSPEVVQCQYGYKYTYTLMGQNKFKWLTNWIFTPEKILRRQREDGTYEEKIEGNLKIFFGTGPTDFEELEFAFWDDMFNSIISLSKMHPSCRQYSRGRQVDMLKNFIWIDALKKKCPIESFEKKIPRRKKELHNKQSAAYAKRAAKEKKAHEQNQTAAMNWDKLKLY